MNRRIAFFVVLFFVVFTTNAQKILFVGNSLTYYNDMPKILEFLGESYGVEIKTKSLAFPNYALEDHLIDGKLQQEILKKYDYVIVQQGPSSQNEGKQMLLRDGATINELCKAEKTELGFFMVWPASRHYYTFDKVIANHELAAKTTKSLLFPVGKLWKEYNELNQKESLYGSDGFHPSKAGSFFAALIIFDELHPEKNLHQLNPTQWRQWIQDEGTFNTMVELVKNR